MSTYMYRDALVPSPQVARTQRAAPNDFRPNRMIKARGVDVERVERGFRVTWMDFAGIHYNDNGTHG